MTTNNLILPILSQMMTSILLLLFWQKVRLQKVISILGSTISLFLAINLVVKTIHYDYLVMHSGNWKPPFGITFVSDSLSATLVLLTTIVGFAVSIFSSAGVSINRLQFGYYPILHFLLMGLTGAFLTGDLFNLYVWFEIVIISSFVLMTLGGRKLQMESAIKYVTMNMLASIIFLTAIGLTYGLTGGLNMADIAESIKHVENKGLVDVIALLFFVGFGIKAAVFPLYFWLPSSYHTPPSAIAAIFGGLLTKMGIYAIIRMFTLIFEINSFISWTFIGVALATMITGALGTINKKNIRRVFSYLIVCHIGFLIAGLGIGTELAITGVIMYLIHDIIIKSNLFLVSGVINKIRGSSDMSRLGGLYKDYPKLSLLFAIVLFSLAGIPPLSGFWPKLPLISEAIKTQHYAVVAGIIFASFVTLFVLARIWAEVFWKNSPKPTSEETDGFGSMKFSHKFMIIAPIVMLTSISLFIGFGAEMITILSERISFELMHPNAYIEAVLGK